MRELTIYRHYMKRTDCYNKAPTQEIKGIQLHDTGATNSYLRRYVDDPQRLGVNQYGMHWNRPGTDMTPGGVIGKDINGKVVVYQLLPFNKRNWLSGSGPNGCANKLGFWGWQTARDDMNDPQYFHDAIKVAGVHFAAYICQQNNLRPNDIAIKGMPMKVVMNHKQLHDCGVASDHADTYEWFRKQGYSMDQFRADIQAAIDEGIKVTIIDCDEEVKPMYRGVVTCSGSHLNLRASKIIDSPVIATMPKGSPVDVLNDSDNDWWQIRYKGHTGYAKHYSQDGSVEWIKKRINDLDMKTIPARNTEDLVPDFGHAPDSPVPIEHSPDGPVPFEHKPFEPIPFDHFPGDPIPVDHDLSQLLIDAKNKLEASMRMEAEAMAAIDRYLAAIDRR